jgi:membrane protein CcdC involved in cytochrome C biogenesis
MMDHIEGPQTDSTTDSTIVIRLRDKVAPCRMKQLRIPELCHHAGALKYVSSILPVSAVNVCSR